MNTVLKSLAIVCALGLGFFSKDIYQAFQSHHFEQPAIDATQYCQLSSDICTLDDVNIVLAQDTVTPMIPNKITVNWPANDEPQLWVELEGKEMSMGVAKFVLQNQGNGQFVGELLLPVCYSDSMTWIGSIQSTQHTLPISVRMQR
ncbi:hypothetical protein A9264_14755 [Vibrio sp. UCD-FRSSP16_10]|uniref:hypothetical protein n=1 Tax=unclassified Vibrio TaxID=2614977 RepID=UPI0007FDD099|nr:MULTISPECIES: hypothetical protein [unclassified Vibrio]OBT09493.1 hypothetical protein A9260_06640 [Vibrio sp. UCD-FRSSP16_30]OBT19535.1 hypothetical protein A9264_14755 [Vibrio sp. UCD-FRSSP16_10]